MPTIRRADSEDAPALAGLVEQYWKFEGITGYQPRRVETILRKALAAPVSAACWLAEDDGVAIGYLFAVFVLSLEHGGLMAEVDEFFVVPGARGLGTGSALLQHAEQSMSNLGLVRLQLQLSVANHQSHEFYVGNGFARRSGYELWDKPLIADHRPASADG